nr:MAG TPA: hypothetical protein [Caudoviricetes sp.]
MGIKQRLSQRSRRHPIPSISKINIMCILHR